ncbi:hypothetical protein C4F40_01205 [Sphingobacterium sp. Ka21]|uniref:RagB/SusD family nutrient uptake outer membrane protein n=2 Tax=Sphingobacterium pedocola TaxID=2082722 RepID=A0ABR9T3V9_9SPHI|nr:hypothetical protein [Sphingobacterium pedocola]
MDFWLECSIIKTRFMRRIIFIICFALGGMFTGCEEFLDKKSDMSLTVIDSPDDLFALMDDISRMNRSAVVLQNASDEYYLTQADLNSLPKEFDRESHVWDLKTQNVEDWNALYHIVHISNVVLDNLEGLNLQETDRQFKVLKGMALFYRSHAYYNLLQIFSKQYNEMSASADLGIVLRTNSDFSVKSRRSTVEESYKQVITDLEKASLLLDPLSAYRTRPSEWACEALLARVYLIMGDFEKSEIHAARCLAISDVLLDYNEIPNNAAAPFQLLNDEIIFYSNTSVAITAQAAKALVPAEVYNQYEEGDLRKSLFFDVRNVARITFKGSYNGSIYNVFNGIATDEVYLILAESYIRLDKLDEALEVLNMLKRHRWNRENFELFSAVTKEECLDILKTERLRQLFFRGQRIIDCRRWRNLGENVMLNRLIGDINVDFDFSTTEMVWNIPDQVLNLTDLSQN